MFRQTLWERVSPLPFICSGKHTPNNNSPPHNGTCHPTEKGKLNYRLTCQSAIKLLKQNNSFSIISKLNESHFCHLEEGCLKMISPAPSSALYVTMCSAWCRSATVYQNCYKIVNPKKLFNKQPSNEIPIKYFHMEWQYNQFFKNPKTAPIVIRGKPLLPPPSLPLHLHLLGNHPAPRTRNHPSETNK